MLTSPSPHGEGGLKCHPVKVHGCRCGPSPRGEGGLKSRDLVHLSLSPPSLPPRGGWIEIRYPRLGCPSGSVPPHTGEGGLKYPRGAPTCRSVWSLPSRGGWIEITVQRTPGSFWPSLPLRGGWIEISHCCTHAFYQRASLPLRGVWIEIG